MIDRRRMRLRSTVLTGGGRVIPKLGLVGYWKTYDTDKFIDRIGATTRTLYQLQYIASTGTLELTHSSIVGTETVTKPTGTADVTAAAGKLTIGSGALWSFSLSNGSTYEYATPLTATQGVVFDTSGNGKHLLFTVADQAAMNAVCQVSREKGSDYLNQTGFSTNFEYDTASLIQTKPAGAYYVENVIRNRPCWKTPSGIANYTNGAYHLQCSGNIGDTSLTITGGDSIQHAGTAIWKCVVEYPDGELEFNIVDVVSDPTCTVVYPLKKNGPVKVWSAWQSAIGQHYSLKGVACYAESLYRLDKRYAVRNESVYSHNYEDVFTTVPWVYKNPLVWQPIGGLASNSFRVDANNVNPMTTLKKVFAGCRYAVQFTSTALGHGLQLSVPIADPFTGRIELSTGINAESSFEGLVSITVGGSNVYSSTFGTYVKTHQVYVENATSIIISVTRTTSGSTSVVYRVGALHLIKNVGTAGTILDKNSNILLLGDSWLDSGHPTGAGFKARLDELIVADGGSGTVIDGATQGMTTEWALKWLPYYLSLYSPNICIINFFTNDNLNLSGQTFIGPDGQTYNLNVNDHDKWGSNIEELIAICKAASCTPIVMLPETTSSESQSVTHMDMQNHVGVPVLVKEWLTKATTSEIADSNFVGNKRNKRSGRKIQNAQTLAYVVATTSSPAAPWVTKPTSALIPIAFGGAVDSIGNPPLYKGRAKYNIPSDSDWNNATMPDCNEARLATGWTYGNANWAYNADGTAKTVSKATLEENGAGLRFYFGPKGVALYSVDQTANDVKIKKTLGVSLQ